MTSKAPVHGELTGRTRFRPLTIRRLLDPDDVLLVLQVEYHNRDTDTSADMTRWRDAGVQDLSELGRLNHKE